MRDIHKITSQIQEVSAGTEEANASLSLISDTATKVEKEMQQTVQSIQSQEVSIEAVSIQYNKMKEKVEA